MEWTSIVYLTTGEQVEFSRYYFNLSEDITINEEDRKLLHVIWNPEDLWLLELQQFWKLLINEEDRKLHVTWNPEDLSLLHIHQVLKITNECFRILSHSKCK